LAGTPAVVLATASVRIAITNANMSNNDASMKGAPGNFTGAVAPMKYANVSVNRNGPKSWETL
jgi:hypothetical protein